MASELANVCVKPRKDDGKGKEKKIGGSALGCLPAGPGGGSGRSGRRPGAAGSRLARTPRLDAVVHLLHPAVEVGPAVLLQGLVRVALVAWRIDAGVEVHGEAEVGGADGGRVLREAG